MKSYSMSRDRLKGLFKAFCVCLIFSTVWFIFGSIEIRNYREKLAFLRRSTRLFCIVAVRDPYDVKAQTVARVWGRKCDAFKFISVIPKNMTELGRGCSTQFECLDLNEIGDVIQPPGFIHDSYYRLTDKIFLAFVYMYEYYGYFDWYLKADDDTFVFVNNLREFLHDKDPSKPVTYGYDLKSRKVSRFHSGGAGYVLSNEAFRRLGSALTRNYSFCPNKGTEDVDVARCLRKLDVYPDTSVDQLGRERFHAMSLHRAYMGNFPAWLYQRRYIPPKEVNR